MSASLFTRRVASATMDWKASRHALRASSCKAATEGAARPSANTLCSSSGDSPPPKLLTAAAMWSAALAANSEVSSSSRRLGVKAALTGTASSPSRRTRPSRCSSSSRVRGCTSSDTSRARLSKLTPPPLRGSLKPRCAISFEERLQLSRLGLNTFDLHRPRPEERLALRSLVGESAGRSAARYVAPRRFALWMQACILEGTRWLLEESASPALWERARAQVGAFLRELADAGRFAGRDADGRWFVICDERLNDDESLAAGRRAVLFGVALRRPGEFQCCLVSHAAGGSSTRAVTLNRLIEPGVRLAEQVETALLRQLASGPALP